MRKIIFFIISFLFIFTSFANSCNYLISSFGSSKEQLENGIGNKFPGRFIQNQFGGEVYFLPVEILCGENKLLNGSMVHYLFLNNKLIEVKLEKFSFQNEANIMNYSIKKFGDFKRPVGSKENFRGNNFWNIGNREIEYVSTDIEGGHVELLAIISKLYSFEINEYYEKVGKWLDSQNQ